MGPYVFSLAVSSLLFAFSDAARIHYGSRRLAVVAGGFALIIPCVLAGARDIGVGLDTIGYGNAVFLAARGSADLATYLWSVDATGFQIGLGFSLLAFFVVRLTASQFWYYFSIELLILLPTYFGLRRLCPGRGLWLAMLCYQLVFYFLGLSAMRQFIAVSFVFLSFVLCLDEKRLLSFVFCAVSISFHVSALPWVLLLLAVALVMKVREGNARVRRYLKPLGAILILASIIAWFNARAAFDLFINLFPQVRRYGSYFLTGGSASNTSFFLFFGLMSFGLWLMAKSGRGFTDFKSRALFLLSLTAFPVYALQSLQAEFIRESYYAWPFFIGCFASLYANKSRLDLRFSIGVAAFFCGCLIQCIWWYVVNDYYGCLPYVSRLLGIA